MHFVQVMHRALPLMSEFCKDRATVKTYILTLQCSIRNCILTKASNGMVLEISS